VPTAPKLTRQRIIDAAFAVLDDAGVDGLTVRALAARLGVKAPALYWHVESKQALLDEMGTVVAREVDDAFGTLPEGTPLADALHHYARVARQAFLAHRDGARTFSGTRLTDPELIRRREKWLAAWVEQGHTVEQVTDAFEVVTAYVVGFVIEEQERAQSAGERYSLDERDALLGPEHPLSVASGHRMFSDPAARFEQQLAVVVPALAATPGGRAKPTGSDR
jgi:AcrR family transcriptional regulator